MIKIIIVFLITMILSGFLMLVFMSLKNINEKQALFFKNAAVFILVCTIISIGALLVITILF